MTFRLPWMQTVIRNAFAFKFNPEYPIRISSTFSLYIERSYVIHRAIGYGFLDMVRNYSDLRDHNLHFFRTHDEYKVSTVQNYNVKESMIEMNPVSTLDPKSNLGDSLQYLDKQENVFDLSPEELKYVLGRLAETRSRPYNKKTIVWLDEMCCKYVDKWSLNDTLYVFDAWLLISAYDTFTSSFFQEVVHMWQRNLSHSSKNNALQILYYLGLSKKPPVHLMEAILGKLVKEKDEISDSEWAVACLSFFRTKTKIRNEAFLLKCIEVAKTLIEGKEIFHLISVFKCLRQAQYYDEPLWKLLDDFIRNDFQGFNFIECTNFLAILSSQNVYSEAYGIIESHCADILSSEIDQQLNSSRDSLRSHPSVRSRTKDIARFLWALTNVGHDLADRTVDVILMVLRVKSKTGEYNREPHFLVDCLQSLVISNIYPKDLLIEVFKEYFLSRVWKLARVKPRYQLYFIYKSCEIECRDVFNIIKRNSLFISQLKPLPDNSENQVRRQEKIKKILTLLQQSRSDIESAECSFILPHVAVAGVVAKCNDVMSPMKQNSKLPCLSDIQNKKIRSVCIELMDPVVCCRDSIRPLGFMKTKLRQLQKLSHSVILFTSHDIREIECSPDPPREFALYLQQKL